MAVAVKSGNNIVCNGTAGTITLAQLVTDINDTAWVEDMGSGVYRIKCPVARTIYIYPNVTLEIGEDETLEIYNTVTSNAAYCLFLSYPSTLAGLPNGTLKMLAGSTLDGLTVDSTANTYGVNFYLGGETDIQGTAVKRITISHTRNITIVPQGSGYYSTRVFDGDIIFNYVDFDYPFANTYLFLFSVHQREATILLKDIRLFNSGAVTAPILMQGVSHLKNLVINNIGIGDSPATGTTRWLWMMGYTGGKIINQVFEANKWYAGYSIQPSVNMIMPVYFPTLSGAYTKKKYGQMYMIFDTMTMNDQGYAFYGYLQNDATIVLKDCTFNATLRTWLLYTDAKIIWWNSSVALPFNVSNAGDNAGAYLVVFGLYLTITDMNDNPIENATVIIKQKDDRETFIFFTDVNGQLIDLYDYHVCLCTNRFKNMSVDEYWSDASNSTYHTVTVLKEGYKSETFNVVMDQDRTQTVQLRPLTKMYLGSTELTAIGLG